MFLLNEAAAPLRLKLYRQGGTLFDAVDVTRGIKVRPEGGFDRVALTNESGAPIYMEAFICAGDVDVQIQTGIQVTVENADAAPVPVYVKNAPAVTGVSDATQAVSAVAAQLVASSGGRRSLRVRNTGTVDVAIGGAAVAFAGAAVVLMPGECWVEDDGAPCEWWAVTETAAGSVAVQEVA
ncbi:MAG TPA: hypothetical protein VJ673_02710 [Aromatoleum sp.]|uniref:hypothetical protein n=1 Tax=Aromatoleum sp. TaxID=2307007 RepID=UPI002B4A555E|nr:hypothetical protein [Aromatoleum sp.]HJV24564.1 hypothetical protein [Aromatoleum sp.]